MKTLIILGTIVIIGTAIFFIFGTSWFWWVVFNKLTKSGTKEETIITLTSAVGDKVSFSTSCTYGIDVDCYPRFFYSINKWIKKEFIIYPSQNTNISKYRPSFTKEDTFELYALPEIWERNPIIEKAIWVIQPTNDWIPWGVTETIKKANYQDSITNDFPILQTLLKDKNQREKLSKKLFDSKGGIFNKSFEIIGIAVAPPENPVTIFTSHQSEYTLRFSEGALYFFNKDYIYEPYSHKFNKEVEKLYLWGYLEGYESNSLKYEMDQSVSFEIENWKRDTRKLLEDRKLQILEEIQQTKDGTTIDEKLKIFLLGEKSESLTKIDESIKDIDIDTRQIESEFLKIKSDKIFFNSFKNTDGQTPEDFFLSCTEKIKKSVLKNK